MNTTEFVFFVKCRGVYDACPSYNDEWQEVYDGCPSSSLSSLTQVNCENAGSSFLFAAILGPNNRQGQVIQNGPQKTHLTQNVSTYFSAGETEVFGQPQLSCWFPSKNVKPEMLHFAIWCPLYLSFNSRKRFFLQQEKMIKWFLVLIFGAVSRTNSSYQSEMKPLWL